MPDNPQVPPGALPTAPTHAPHQSAPPDGAALERPTPPSGTAATADGPISSSPETPAPVPIAASGLRRRLVPWALVIGVSVAVLLLYSRGRSLRDQYDDAYITYRYALQLARGHGLVFNVGDRIDSASSFLWTLLLAIPYRLGLDDLELVAVVLGLATTAAIAAIVYSATLRLGLPTWLAAGAGFLSGVHGLVSGWAMSGMETGFYALLVTWFVSETLLRSPSGRTAPLAASLVILARVEGLAVLAVWALEELWTARSKKSPLAPELRRLAMAFGPPLLVAAGFFLFKYLYYGTLLPDAYHLKRILRPYQPDARELLDAWLKTAAVPLALALVGLSWLWLRRQRGALGISVLLVLTAVSCATGPRAAWARYSIHVLPAVMILAAIGVAALARRARPIGAVAGLLAALQTGASCWMLSTYLASFSEHQRCRRAVGTYLREHVDPSEVVLSTDIGAIAYAAPDFSFIDTVGLTSRDVFDRYRAGASLDPLLAARRPRFAADTWSPGRAGARGRYKAQDKLQSPGRLLTVPAKPSRYASTLQDSGVLFKCRAQRTWFAVGPIGQRD